jgi:Holliday junction resolvase RusA-like endonuclease
MSVSIRIPGTPRPQPRPRVYHGHAVSVLDPNAKLWVAAVDTAVAGYIRSGGKPEQDAGNGLACYLEFYFPTKDKKRWGRPHIMTPDTDNLCKLVLDRITPDPKKGRPGLFIGDDRIIYSIFAEKRWCEPGKESAMVWIGSGRKIEA